MGDITSTVSTHVFHVGYLGCYYLPLPAPYISDKDMTIQLCIETCRVVNTTHALLQASDCYCLNHTDIQVMTPVPEVNCSTPCPGHWAQRCGGENGSAVFSIGGCTHKLQIK